MDLREQIAHAAKYPKMYGLDGTDAPATAFVVGVDVGTGGRLLEGFNEWLQVRLGRVSSLAFPGLVAETGADLFSCLDEFLAARGAGGGLAQIYDAYLELLRAEGLYESRKASWSR